MKGDSCCIQLEGQAMSLTLDAQIRELSDDEVALISGGIGEIMWVTNVIIIDGDEYLQHEEFQKTSSGWRATGNAWVDALPMNMSGF